MPQNDIINEMRELARQLEYTFTLSNCSGVACFSYQYFFDAAGNTVEETSEEVLSLVSYLRIKKLP